MGSHGGPAGLANPIAVLVYFQPRAARNVGFFVNWDLAYVSLTRSRRIYGVPRRYAVRVQPQGWHLAFGAPEPNPAGLTNPPAYVEKRKFTGNAGSTCLLTWHLAYV